MEMDNKEEEMLTRVKQINLQQLRILARRLDFTDEEGIKSRLLKIALWKLSSDNCDPAKRKKKLCIIVGTRRYWY